MSMRINKDMSNISREGLCGHDLVLQLAGLHQHVICTVLNDLVWV